MFGCLFPASPRVLFRAAALSLLAAANTHAAVYYVAAEGADDRGGLTPETAWRSLERASTAPLAPGDQMLFHRGDVWRGQLRARSGSESAPITYGAYGEGPKPLFLGSMQLNRPEDWVLEKENLWTTAPPRGIGPELLSNPSFEANTDAWSLYCEDGAAAKGSRTTEVFDSAPAGYQIQCQNAGKRGCDIQFFTAPFAITAGKNYRLAFRAKCGPAFSLPVPVLMRSGAPWEPYGTSSPRANRLCADEWAAFEFFIHASKTADNARLTFFLGDTMPAGAVLWIDSLTLSECEGIIASDVGNIIFNDEAVCGVKVWNESDLRDQGQFWYDEERRLVKLFSATPPAQFYSNIECALREHIIDESNVHDAVYENLALKYGAAHGIGGGNTHHITVRGCDFGFIGGGDQMGGEKTVRFGNGVEFWGAAHDNLVEHCRLWEIYDAALTNQSSGPNTPQFNIVYRFNIIWNSEYSFEYWNRPEASETHHVYFENNTCFNAGGGWGHAQRPDPSGRHLCFYDSPARAHAIFIRNNIFCEATRNAFYAPGWPREAIDALEMDNNCWTQAEGQMIAFKDRAYTMAEFSTYQLDYAKEPHSLAADPEFENPAGRDFHLRPGSPCIGAGLPTGQTADFESGPIPQGNAPDIGALERK